jgi:hypothetical protein
MIEQHNPEGQLNMKSLISASTGITSLDEVINNLHMGDNVVWQVDSINDYREFAIPFANKAIEENRRLVYMRFAQHDPIIEFKGGNTVVYTLDATSGFELFSKEVYTIITREGEDVFYLFDCLSDLLTAWATDLMIGNFFAITCPYLYELNTVAYFALLRNSHSFKTIARIREITQVLIEAYNCDNSCYVQPLKVLNRYSPTMFLPHSMKDDTLIPITNSEDASLFLGHIQHRSWERTSRNLDYWDRVFLRAEDLVAQGAGEQEKKQMVEFLCKIMIGREKRMLGLATEHFTLEDLIEIKYRMIGTGYIGGKAAGMLLARAILRSDSSRDWSVVLEPHDSFYIGSDVFYTYIVQNGWWRRLMEQKTPEGYFAVAEELREKMLTGTFPEEIKEQFQRMIEYMGQSPIIVRSSSLLEDSFGNAFAGKYDSLFRVNQGSPKQRYQEFTEAVRTIFASAMNEDALAYRLQRGLDQLDEQMALLVQRVSGTHHHKYFFPDMGGVGFSYNAYVWKHGMDPEAGMLRLVFGLGTRAVNRVEGDYPRIVALDQPLLKPLSGMADIRRFSQHDVDILNIADNTIETVPIADVLEVASDNLRMPLELAGQRDTDAEQQLRQMGIQGKGVWVFTFDELLSNTPFSGDMQRMMKRIESVYNYPVDIEFTVNFSHDGSYRINLLQCRPHQTKGSQNRVIIPTDIPEGHILFASSGNFLGGGIAQAIRQIIFVEPQAYSDLTQTGKYDIARLIGRLNKLIKDRNDMPTLLLGPGRWGTTTPSLGVPVRFAEINNIRILVEIALMSDNVMPELSFGTHFFQDLVETDIFYIALFPENPGVMFNRSIIDALPNRLIDLLPDSARYEHVVKAIDVPDSSLKVMADIISQKVVGYR